MRKQETTAASLDLEEVRHLSILALLAIGMYLLFCSPAFAGVIGSMLCDTVGMVFLDIGRGLATIAVVALGAGAMMGKVSWGQGVIVIIGIGIVFGAGTVVWTLTMTPSVMGGSLLAGITANPVYAGIAAGSVAGCFGPGISFTR